eukprot:TRINITY_DN2959_c0_g1_i1.p1 TRINITY_DN2959_c0_g1~~TRINITY_DN2959_c0_g1_i1.p1  ORF type:complete len:276 (+),score=37.92 TRINITY_DN2959_c0_g1_i1:114-941(+)
MWSFMRAGQYHNCDLELNAELEKSFQDFWQGQGPGQLKLRDDRKVDFQRLQLVSMEGSKDATQPLVRQEPGEASHPSGCEAIVEWGHGHDYHPKRGEEEPGRNSSSSTLSSGSCDTGLFAAYSPEINALLEESYRRFHEASELKGVLFTSTNGADYLVEFPTMLQLRLQTRRSRLVYRHRVAKGLRGCAEGAPAQKATSQYISAVPRPLAVASCQQNSASGSACSSRSKHVQSQAPGKPAPSSWLWMMPCINQDSPCFGGLIRRWGTDGGRRNVE